MNAEMAIELRTLAANYADAVDQRDQELLLSAFHSDATLEIIRPAGTDPRPNNVLRGHSEIGRIVTAITKYRHTFHMLGQSTYLPTGKGASGLVACIAHHRWTDTEDLDHIMYIRYADEYRIGDDNRWRISARQLHVQWTETRVVNVPGKVP